LGAPTGRSPSRRPPTLSFFFQAEDGIRALYVTGVQTCALPIYAGERPPCRRHRRWADQRRVAGGARQRLQRKRRCRQAPLRPDRSEERRGGKEGGARGTRRLGAKGKSAAQTAQAEHGRPPTSAW